jgi:hypothetical protein
MNDKRIQCPSGLCQQELFLDGQRFDIRQNEDGTWTAMTAVQCMFCNLVFVVESSRVTFVRVHYPTIAEMKTLPRYQEYT